MLLQVTLFHSFLWLSNIILYQYVCVYTYIHILYIIYIIYKRQDMEAT